MNSATISGRGAGMTTFSTSNPFRAITAAPTSTASLDRSDVAGHRHPSFAADRHRQVDGDQLNGCRLDRGVGSLDDRRHAERFDHAERFEFRQVAHAADGRKYRRMQSWGSRNGPPPCGLRPPTRLRRSELTASTSPPTSTMYLPGQIVRLTTSADVGRLQHRVSDFKTLGDARRFDDANCVAVVHLCCRFMLSYLRSNGHRRDRCADDTSKRDRRCWRGPGSRVGRRRRCRSHRLVSPHHPHEPSVWPVGRCASRAEW